MLVHAAMLFITQPHKLSLTSALLEVEWLLPASPLTSLRECLASLFVAQIDDVQRH